MLGERVFIVSAKRTPFGRFRGALSGLGAVELVRAAAEAACAGLERELISRLILGVCLPAGQGMNLARQAALACGLSQAATGYTINMMCGSGLKALAAGADLIRLGEVRAVLAGGVESMSQSPLLVARPGKGQSADVNQISDSMLLDGLRDTGIGEHMGETAERLAGEFGVSRVEQDLWAVRSQLLYAEGLAGGEFRDELAEAGGVSADEHPRPGVGLSELSGLRPIFSETGTVTAGNSSGINDGAAVAVLASESLVAERGWPVLCEWVGAFEQGCDPLRMGLGPVYAAAGLLERHGLRWDEIDQLEINEAFAAQVLSCLSALGLGETVGAVAVSQRPRVNVHGGAIAVGHPLAASGARLAVHQAWQIARGRAGTCVSALCIGGGMGIAALLRSAGGIRN